MPPHPKPWADLASSSRGSSCVGLARKRRKPRKARKGNESAEANARSAEARGSTRKRQMTSSQFGLLILITPQMTREGISPREKMRARVAGEEKVAKAWPCA